MIRNAGPGMLHLYFGQGVGKTSRVVGLAVRAAGAGLGVDFVQFMKSGNSSEVAVFRKIPLIRYQCPGTHPFILSRGPETVHRDHAAEAFRMARDSSRGEGGRVLICDEILDTLLFDLLRLDQILDLAEQCRDRVELVMTGRDAPPELIEKADYVTEFVQHKHPYYAGAKARRGIEY